MKKRKRRERTAINRELFSFQSLLLISSFQYRIPSVGNCPPSGSHLFLPSLQGSLSVHGRAYSVIDCTKRAVFESTLPTLTGVNVLVTSVLSNFISDACTGDNILAPANKEITDHVEALHQYSLGYPEVRIVVAPPLPRSSPDWFLAYLPGFSSFLYHEVNRMGNPRIKFLSPFVAPPTFFEADGVHLNADAGASFIFYLVAGSDQLFPPTPEAGSVAPEVSSQMVSSSLASLSRSVSELRSDVRRRRLQDNLIFARIKEDRDYEINKSREDRCTISGLTVTLPPPSDPKQGKDFFKGLMSKLVEEACPDPESQPKVLDVQVNMRIGRGPPFFEVKFDSAASSLKFRILASKLAKDGTGSFRGLFISNTVNMTTRIRIDIMKLIAKKLSTPTEVGYVQGFSSRPMLHYRVKEQVQEPGPLHAAQVPAAAGTGRSYSFVESVERWGHLLSPFNVEPIRRKASQAFRGCLEQYFVVLSDGPPTASDDGIFSRLTAPGSFSGRARHRGQRGSRPYGRGGRQAPKNSWAKYDVDARITPHAEGSLAGHGAKRGPPSDVDSSEGPAKKKAESE